MRTLSKSLAGAVIAGALILSASPSWALGSEDPTADVQTPVEPTEVETSQVDAETATDDSSSAVADSVEDPAASGSATEDSDEDSAEVVDLDEMLPAAPGAVDVSGTLVVIADEVGGATSEGDELVIGEPATGQVLVATDAGPLVPIDEALVGADAETGARFEGQLALSGAQKAAVDEAIADAAEGVLPELGLTPVDEPAALAETPQEGLSAEQVIDVAAANADETGEGLAVIGSVTATAAEQADAGVTNAISRRHDVDIAYISNAGASRPSAATLKGLLGYASDFWKGQSNNKVSELRPSASVKFATSTKTWRCQQGNVNAVWDKSARLFGRTPNSYLGTGRHLVVVVDDNCGKPQGYATGWGTIGKLHYGGMTWIDAGSRPAGKPYSAVTDIVAHEIGHNLGLGHGNVRNCSGSAVDSAGGKSPCWLSEYTDIYSIMGASPGNGGALPPALPIAQKDALGVLASGQMKTVSAAGGRSQQFTLQAGGATSGLRGLKVKSPTGGTFYVEYRTPTGADRNLNFKPNTIYRQGGSYSRHQGVRIMKRASGMGESTTLIGVRDTQQMSDGTYWNGIYQTGRAGKTMSTHYSTANVYVNSISNTQAVVTVRFTPFTDVPYEHKFAGEIGWMSTSGLSNGYKSGSTRVYKPKAAVTREAMAAFLYRLNTPSGQAGPAGYVKPKTSPFRDVSTKHQFYKEIAWMYKSKLSTGTKQKTGKPVYAPKGAVTRDAMAAFIYRMDTKPKPAALKTSPFVDVSKKHKFYKEISWMYQTKLSTGTKQPSGKPKYQPGSAVTREAMAAFIYRYKH